MKQIMFILFIIVTLTWAVEASPLYVNHEKYEFKDQVVTYTPDFMYVISDKERKGELRKLTPVVSVKVEGAPIQQGIVKQLEAEKPMAVPKEDSKPKISMPQKYTVYFDFNSFKIREDQKEVLKSIPSAGTIVDVYGYTCVIGSKEYNKKLSLKRAKEVSKFLQSRNIAIGKEVGMGPTDENKDLKLNRKVEVIIQ